MSIVNSISVFKSSNQNHYLQSANNIMRADWIVCARDATSFRNLEFFVLTAIMSNSNNVLMSLNIQGRRTVTKPKMNINYTGVNGLTSNSDNVFDVKYPRTPNIKEIKTITNSSKR